MKLGDLIRERYDEMSGGRKQIASFILANEAESMYLTSKEVAERVGTSESTVVRFAYFLGFHRYKDMQEYSRSKGGGFDIIEQFKRSSTERQWESPSLRAVEQDLLNIHDTFAGLDGAVLGRIADALLHARRIGVVSVRGGLAPALLLHHFLNEVLENSVLLSPGTGDCFDKIKSWGQEDVLFCFEYTPTKGHSYQTLKFGRERGCRILSVVSELAYTIKELSDEVLEVKKEGTFISYTSSVVLVNVLLDLIAQRAQERIMPKLEETFQILKQLDKGVL